MDTDSRNRLENALEKRRAYRAPGGEDTDVGRLINSDADGFPGITADRLGRAVLIEAHSRDCDPSAIIEHLESHLGPKTPLFLKERWSSSRRGRAGWQVAGPLCHPEFTVTENGSLFRIRLTADEHIGLFLDARPARKRVREIAEGCRVLNLFSYTGGFGVAAAKGGARSTTNIDNKRSALKIAEKNYRLNQLPFDTRTFLRDDVFRHITRRAKGLGRYDLIIVDPPAISLGPGNRRFDAKKNYVNLAAKCLPLLSPSGVFLAGINAAGVSSDQFEDMLREAAAQSGKNIDIIEKLLPGEDFRTI